jgi:hypothetical protein
MSQKPDLERVFNFLRGEGLDTTPETWGKQPAPDPAPDNVELRDLPAPGRSGEKDDETSSYESAAPQPAPERTSTEVGDERRVVKYVPKWSCFAFDWLHLFCRD